MYDFKKYPSIENHYRQKEIEKFLAVNPEFVNERFVIQEKIHGSNLQIIFNKMGGHCFASRNKILDENDNFFDVKNVMEKQNYVIIELSKLAMKLNQQINVYGELFGPGIQKGVYYGTDKDFRIFDISIDGVFMPPSELWKFITFNLFNILPQQILVPYIEIVKDFKTALEYDTKFNSHIRPWMNVHFNPLNKENLVEGVVIKPYEKVYLNHNDSPFMLKKKNEEFKQKQHSQNTYIRSPFSEEVKDIKNNFLEYVNDNRLQGIFSKAGMIESKTQIGYYIGLLIVDARKDFLKDVEIDLDFFSKKEIKFIFNCGEYCFKLISNYIKSS